MLKVFKFGGSSVKDAAAMKAVSEIVLRNNDCKIVVISATKNTTNELESIATLSLDSIQKANESWANTISRHSEIAQELQVAFDFSDLEKEVLSLINRIFEQKAIIPKVMDQLYSVGERLSTRILAEYLKKALKRPVQYKDVREVLITNDNWLKASPLITETKDAFDSKWKDVALNSLIVTQGFVGMTSKGETTTLGREGSDFTATILGESLGANEVTIWTDVAGVATSDPRVVDNTKFIKKLNYQEASTLAKLGAKVLFERTLEPAIRKGFPVVVKSTQSPVEVGSIISNCSSHSGPMAVTVEEDILSIVGGKLLSEEAHCSKTLLDENKIEYLVHEQVDHFICFKIPSLQMDRALNVVHNWILKFHQSE